LTITVGQSLVAAKEAFDEQAALPRPIPVTDDVLVSPEVPYRDR